MYFENVGVPPLNVTDCIRMIYITHQFKNMLVINEKTIKHFNITIPGHP